jgi:N-acetyl-alpha-D-glucosaminyl L-malate synthase BshA
VVKYEKLDLLHVHYAIPHASAAYMAQQILLQQGIKIPFITTLHGTDITLVGKDPSFEPVITFSINQSNVVTAVSESLKKDTLEHFKIKKDVKVIPNFICLEDYKQYNNQKYKQRIALNNEKVISHISNFRKVKRIQDVLHSFKIINDSTPSKLILVGDGPERPKMEKLSRDLKISKNVNFLGNLKSTKEVLNISDLFVLPSSSESFGLAALEALACGVPVISTNRGGIPEVVENGKSGLLSKVGDFREMGENALKIISNEAIHQDFKANAIISAKKI